MRLKRVILWVAGTFALLIGLAVGYYNFILDWDAKPICHKLIMIGFMAAMHESGINFANDPKPFPNVKGVSRDSLTNICEQMGGYVDWVKDYGYVPGLREDDPGELVLMYFNRPTRWTWHGVAPTIFKEKAWILIPVDFGDGMRPKSGPGEQSERVSLDEFRSRLKQTIDFIRTNERPNWQAIVAEQTKFLDSIDHVVQ
jgi:hypothetical protein